MRHLLDKYKNNTLTPEELEQLRDALSCGDGEEIARLMEEDWSAGNFAECADDAAISDILGRLKTKIAQQEQRMRDAEKRRYTFRRVWQAVAAVLIPMLVLTTVYFYHSSTLHLENATIVMTEKGENATIVLPDESKVSLKSLSCLSYYVSAFNRDERNIEYSGEGKFSVSADKEHPFVVQIDGMQIKVLGTQFYVTARKEEPIAKVYLETGKLELTATLTGKSVVMMPNQLALLNKETGTLTVTTDSDKSEISAIVNHELRFNNTPIAEVIKRMSVNYNYKFKVGENIENLPFTGILPTDDILEAIKILDVAFDLKSNITDKEITLSSR
jgi:ferric-dicitrate binding protein FerR (iron transport regulator)